MNEKEVLLALESNKFITHSKRNSMYKLNDKVMVDGPNNWVEYITYTDLNSGITYARRAGMFENFSLTFVE